MSASCLDLLDHLHGSVSVVGSMNVDYTVVTERLPKPGETVNGGPLTLLPGGKSANQASAAARIGAQVRMFGAVGEDTNADFCWSICAMLVWILRISLPLQVPVALR